MFRSLDLDGGGTISPEELDQADDSIRQELLRFVPADNLKELYEMLDVDGSGEVDIEEFCYGVSRLVISEQPVEFIRIMKQLQLARRENAFIREYLLEVKAYMEGAKAG